MTSICGAGSGGTWQLQIKIHFSIQTFLLFRGDKLNWTAEVSNMLLNPACGVILHVISSWESVSDSY